MKAKNIPNVVLIISDHHRWDHMGFMNPSLITPNLDQLAKSGTCVGSVYCNSPLCVPSRASILLGRYPMNSGVFTNRHPVPPQSPTFVRQLAAEGVHTALIGKAHHHIHAFDADYIAHEIDLHTLGYEYVHEVSSKSGVTAMNIECHYARYLRSLGILESSRAWEGRWGTNSGSKRSRIEPWPWPEHTRIDSYTTERACEFISNVRLDKPFYLQIGLYNPHFPDDAPERFREMYHSPNVPKPEPKTDEPLDLERWIAFASGVTEMDEKVGRVIEALRGRGILEDTVILYTSDHGDMAGDHGRFGKGVFYEGSVHVPLIASGPGIPRNKRVQAMAELVDLGKTICDFLGRPSHHYDQGHSLKPLLTGQRTHHRSDIFAEMGSDKMLFDGRYKLMYGDWTRDTREEWNRSPFHGPAFGRPVNLPPDKISIFDLEVDPYETNNLADDSQFEHLKVNLQQRLLNRLIENMQAVPEGNGSVM